MKEKTKGEQDLEKSRRNDKRGPEKLWKSTLTISSYLLRLESIISQVPSPFLLGATDYPSSARRQTGCSDPTNDSS